MLDGAMRVVQDTSEVCVIHSGGSSLGTFSAVFGGSLVVVLFIISRLVPSIKERAGKGYSFIFPFVLTVIVFPIMLSGESNTLELSRSASTLAVSRRQFLVWASTRTYPLSQIFSASNTGRYNQLRINFTDGSYSNIGYDTTDGGRDEAVAAINNWLGQYRGQPPSMAR